MKTRGKMRLATLDVDGIALLSPRKTRSLRIRKLHLALTDRLTVCGKFGYVPDLYLFKEIPIDERCDRCHNTYLTLLSTINETKEQAS